MRPADGPLLCVVGARPNYMKMAPLLRAIELHSGLPGAVLVHTGQHYDIELNELVFSALGLPQADVNLEVGSGSHAQQTAEVMKRFEPVVDEHQPSCVIVVGDVNSTLACALVASKKQVPVVHVEAGLRSFDRAMPEEINRLLTDQIAELLFTTERSAHRNLAREGIAQERVHFVGNLMIDSLLAALPKAVPVVDVLNREALEVDGLAGGYAALTLHRPSNVDDRNTLSNIVAVIREVADRLPVIWPIHPRTRANIERFGLASQLHPGGRRIVCLPPQGYLEMVGLMRDATLMLTDSGGIQEETTALGVPCLTMRENTERPITVDEGTNTVVGNDRRRILAAVDDVLESGGKRGRVPEYWDGKAAPRIAEHLARWLASRGVRTPELVGD